MKNILILNHKIEEYIKQFFFECFYWKWKYLDLYNRDTCKMTIYIRFPLHLFIFYKISSEISLNGI